ncbi:MAG TPA: sarcosine oxidase subunit gamma family protein [Steroidobacteraceae bacterium]|nr:sarcosine oxidase subunit gamma family protein [Steroidobacteraceae bacterium]
MHADSADIAASAFAGMPAIIGSGDGVIATERIGLGIARIAARSGRAAGMAELLRAQLGLELPDGPSCTSRGDVRIAGIGPGSWLATRNQAGNAFAASLRSLLGDCASVSDQSDAYVILRLAGPKVRETLAKLVPIDVHHRSFQAGDVAQTVCGYLNVILWRLEDTPQRDPVFEIWVGRSLAVSLHQAISHSAAEFGFKRHPA